MKLYQFLKENLDVLKETAPGLHAWLWSQEYDMQTLETSIFQNEHGTLDWRMQNGQGLFEPAPPVAYYNAWKPGDKAEQSATVLVGCNLGYGVNHVLMTTPSSHKVFVLEPRAEMLLACLGQTDYREFIRAGRLRFVAPLESELQEMVRGLDLQFLFGRVVVREDLPSRQIGPEYAHWIQRCRARLESFSVEMTTLRMQQDTMVGNELKNFARAAGDGSLMPLKGAGDGLSAVLFGAGPSLMRFTEHFQGVPRALQVTSLQAMPSLQKNGIKPHLCLAIDYSTGMRQIFKRLDADAAKDVPLIYSTKMDPMALAAYPGPTIPLWTLGGLSTFVFGGRELVLDAGGNVGVTLLRLLDWMGVRRVLFVGQDFACPGDTTHAAGHHGSRDVTQVAATYNTMVTDANGNPIRTSPQLLAARRDMEDDLARSTISAFNLYGGGSPIKGATPVTWEDVEAKSLLDCAPEALRAFGSALVRAHMPRPRPVFEARSQVWANSLRHVERRLAKLFKKVEKRQRDINQALIDVEVFVKQDPLYSPYLFNEIMDLSGLIRARTRYVSTDFKEIKALFSRVLAKVREMDAALAPGSAQAA